MLGSARRVSFVLGNGRLNALSIGRVQRQWMIVGDGSPAFRFSWAAHGLGSRLVARRPPAPLPSERKPDSKIVVGPRSCWICLLFSDARADGDFAPRLGILEG